MQRYFIEKSNIDLINKKVIIDKNNYHHMKNVLRYKINTKVIVCYNEEEYLCVITNIDEVITLDIISKITVNRELNSYICIAQGLVKKDKQNEVIRRLVELGCSCYLNVCMERCIIKPKENSSVNTRNEVIIKEASEQSRRNKLMELKEVMTFKQFLEYSSEFDLKIVCYEESNSDSKILKNTLKNINNKKIIILVGPEGGISGDEIIKLKEIGFICVGLGKRILRTETAPLYIMSVISYELESSYE